jgi:hypothetical protein
MKLSVSKEEPMQFGWTVAGVDQLQGVQFASVDQPKEVQFASVGECL